MTRRIRITSPIPLTHGERDRLAATLGDLTSLDKVLGWMRDRTPALRVEEIVTQDEYTHDVIVPLSDSRFLVFDTN